MLTKRLVVMAHDTVAIALALYLSFVLRFDSFTFPAYFPQFLVVLPFALGVWLSLFYLYGLYSGMWRFIGIQDLTKIIKAATLGAVYIVAAFLLFRERGLEGYPRSTIVISWFIVIAFIGGSRLSYRMFRESSNEPITKKGPKTNVLIVGAGQAGEIILREILANKNLPYNLIGFVDDSRAKRNASLHGYPILGNTRDIPKLAHKYSLSTIFIAVPSASGKAKRRIMMTCKRTGLTVKTLPSVGELLTGKAVVNALRDFQIEDLLGRAPVILDEASIGDYVRNKTVMITGAGGSIGSELCRQVARFSPTRLVLFERGEFNLYQIHMELLGMFPDMEISAVIGDVLNRSSVERVMVKNAPDVVFHAAAYKHVPLMEMNPVEALRNNVLGTWMVAELAHAHGVRKFVMISTDKAVRPTNIMGASKRMAELICQSFFPRSTTQFVTVRFGNVLNSAGSVVPLFKKQIEMGGPLTVTHRDIYRYFMTIPEAVQLIMQAGAMGKGREIFILDMGDPVRIVDLARDMITLSGLEPEKDIRIVFTGLRPGEKLYEELLTGGEEVKPTTHEKIKVAEMESVDGIALLAKLDELIIESMRNGFTQVLEKKIKEIVPEYQPENGGPETPLQSLRTTSYDRYRETSAGSRPQAS